MDQSHRALPELGEFTLHSMLRSQAERVPDRVGVRIGGEDLTYTTLVEQSTAAANTLTKLGIGPGDVIALLTANSKEQVLLSFAASMVGAIEVTINTAYRGDFLAHQLRDSGARLIVVDSDLLPEVERVRAEAPDLRWIFERAVAGVPLAAGGPRHSSSELFGEDPHRLASDHRPLETDPCSIVYTSGTTGPSKGAVLGQRYMVTLARQQSRLLWRDDGSRLYSCAPMFHLAGKGVGVLGALSRGISTVVDERFSVSQFWTRIREEQCTGTMLLGSMVTLLWGAEPSPQEGIDVIYAVPIPADLQPAMSERWKCTFSAAYGLSESAPVCFSDAFDELRPGSAGRVERELYDVRIFSDTDEELPTGTPGEVVIRPTSPGVMFDGYWNNPAATLSQYRNLWFHTGDIGTFDEDGYFYFLDRKKDYLRRRGENISSYEVETAVMKHTAVLEAAVVGVPSEMSEDEVKVSIVLRSGTDLSFTDLIDHCVATMPYFAVPRFVEYLDDLPRTSSGKVEKFRLRETGTEGCWDREAAGIRLSGKRPQPAQSRR